MSNPISGNETLEDLCRIIPTPRVTADGRYRRGYRAPDGRVFWRYRRGGVKESWLSPEEYERYIWVIRRRRKRVR